MTTTTHNTKNSFSIELLKQLAFMQHEGDNFFILNGIAYEGDRDEEEEKYEEIKDQFESFGEYCSQELTEIEEFDNDNYLVLTDEEADEKAAEYIKESLWAFTPSFLASMTEFDEEIFQAIADNGKCESNNDVIYNTVQKTCGIDELVEAAIQEDGRGHFMSSYDGEENEETVEAQGEDGELTHTFYIYRQN